MRRSFARTGTSESTATGANYQSTWQSARYDATAQGIQRKLKMKIQESKPVDHRPSSTPLPTWSELFSYWQSKQVPLIEMIPFVREEHYGPAPWFEKHLTPDERRGKYHFLSKGPLVGTATNLLSDPLRTNPELYAAFAILCTLLIAGERSSRLMHLVEDRLSLADFNPWSCWHSNSVMVLPCVPNEHQLRKYDDWQTRVDVAAAVWIEICARFQVIRDSQLWFIPAATEAASSHAQ